MDHPLDPRTEQAILLITTRFREPLLLSDLASEVGLSPFHFQRRFKAETGQTPAAYLSRVRLEHAAHLAVVLPDAPLVQIAFESGFSSAATFARAFRQHFQQAPSDYRQQRKLALNEQDAPPSLNLQRLPMRSVRVSRCPLHEDALTQAYRQLGQVASSSQRTALGIFVDAPFHQDRARCRHFLALETSSPGLGSDHLQLPGGLYACLRVSGDIDALSARILRFKAEQLDPSPYAIASTLAFERVPLPAVADAFDYALSERELFIKVRHKHEPAI